MLLLLARKKTSCLGILSVIISLQVFLPLRIIVVTIEEEDPRAFLSQLPKYSFQIGTCLNNKLSTTSMHIDEKTKCYILYLIVCYNRCYYVYQVGFYSA